MVLEQVHCVHILVHRRVQGLPRLIETRARKVRRTLREDRQIAELVRMHQEHLIDAVDCGHPEDLGVVVQLAISEGRFIDRRDVHRGPASVIRRVHLIEDENLCRARLMLFRIGQNERFLLVGAPCHAADMVHEVTSTLVRPHVAAITLLEEVGVRNVEL